MKRHYFVTSDLNEFQLVESELVTKGIESRQIHLLEKSGNAVREQSRSWCALFFNEVVCAGVKGTVFGLVLAGIVLSVGYMVNADRALEWMPFIVLALLVLGFSIWESSNLEYRKSNEQFRRFGKVLAQGMYVLFIDVEDCQALDLQSVVTHHPRLSPAGVDNEP